MKESSNAREFLLMLAIGTALVTMGLGRQIEINKIASPDPKVMMGTDDLRWAMGPHALPHGAEMALLEGKPGLPGPFTMRLRLPAGYAVPSYWDPANEHITVLDGTVYIEEGAALDKSKGRVLGAGGFALLPARSKHSFWTRNGATIQVHGLGPWEILYAEPSRDPRAEIKG